MATIDLVVVLNNHISATTSKDNLPKCVELRMQLTGVSRATLELTFRSDNTRRAGVEA